MKLQGFSQQNPEQPQTGTYPCPEVPARTLNIYNHLLKEGLLARMQGLALEDLSAELVAFVETKLLTLSHSPQYIEEIKTKCSQIKDEEFAIADQANDIYYCSRSYVGACLAVLATVRGVQTVLQEDEGAERLKRGYCIVRPPGHHSKCGDSAGFCIFNNVAIAAHYAKNLGKRVCIFDWDIHHGDGTQSAFYKDD